MNTIPDTSRQTIQADLESLSTFNATPGNGITRLVFTKEDVAARDFLKRRMRETGLDVREDAVGNIFGRLEGQRPELAPVWTGSHFDTVLNAGMFDGMAGVVAGIEALRVIKESAVSHERSLEVIAFTSEEPTRFGIWGLGSHFMAGALCRDNLATIVDESGKPLDSILSGFGYDIDAIDNIKRNPGDVHAFIELHIEQAPLLDRSKVPVGVVESICGLTSIDITVTGVQGHAGSTPKPERCDPVPAFSEICLYFESLINGFEEPYPVGTIGKIQVNPNASNVIPKSVTFSVDMRGRDMASKDEVLDQLATFIRGVEQRRGVKIETIVNTHEFPVESSERIVNVLSQSAENLGYAYTRLVSGAFHDTVMISRFAPIGMIFIPCRDGISHNPDEWADYNDIKKGADVLANALLQLANE